jgi:hypothetical protein
VGCAPRGRTLASPCEVHVESHAGAFQTDEGGGARGGGADGAGRDRAGPARALLRHQPGAVYGGGGAPLRAAGQPFWPALHLSGFTERRLSPFEERELLARGLGITNVVAHATAAAEPFPEESIGEVVGGAHFFQTLVVRVAS